MQRVQIEWQPNDWIIIALRRRQLRARKFLCSLSLSNALAVFEGVWIAARRQSRRVQQSRCLREPTTRPSARGNTKCVGHDCGTFEPFVTVLPHHTVQLAAIARDRATHTHTANLRSLRRQSPPPLLAPSTSTAIRSLSSHWECQHIDGGHARSRLLAASSLPLLNPRTKPQTQGVFKKLSIVQQVSAPAGAPARALRI